MNKDEIPKRINNMNFKTIELEVIRWGEKRGIVENGKAMSQAIKTLEETTELLDAINRGDRAEVIDAIGDVMVTLTMICAIEDIDLTRCFESAYHQIKDRKGYLTAEGTFIKES